MNDDRTYVRVLSIVYYILSGIFALGGFFPALYIFIGIMIINAPPPPANNPQGGPPPEAFGWIFVVLGAVACVVIWFYAFCLFLSGRFLGARKHYLYCLIVAGVSCLFVPAGTVLGVFTFIVLLRPNVKEMFEGPAMVLPADAREDS